jgi:hypothetical protein
MKKDPVCNMDVKEEASSGDAAQRDFSPQSLISKWRVIALLMLVY